MINLKNKKALIIGSGGLRIGQAGEFDYSGSQAIKAFKQEGLIVTLINPNIATVQTDKLANLSSIYLLPPNVLYTASLIQIEKPDYLALSFGGQTALNLGMELESNGFLDRIEILGTSIDSIRKTEDRDLFKTELDKINIKTPKSYCAFNVEDGLRYANEIGYPLMIRSGFSLGGLGSGKIHDKETLKKRLEECFSNLNQVLIEEYLAWQEYEFEIVRDAFDNIVVVCCMENLDPMGVHTGDSIVVAPAQTLSDSNYQKLRNISIEVARHFKIIGECNIQFAIKDQGDCFDYRVIEMNARLSRSSALASKATGYPLAYVAAKLALGYRLYDIKNDITKITTAFYEPSLDYVVVKIPLWNTNKMRFPGKTDRTVDTQMKSVGEGMGVGRTFQEALQKAVSVLNLDANCLGDNTFIFDDIKSEIINPNDRRLFAIYKYFLDGGTVNEVFEMSGINTWFLNQIKSIADFQSKLVNTKLTPELVLQAKKFGISDRLLCKYFGLSEENLRNYRFKNNIVPFIKQIDTLGGEFDAQTNYLYLTYEATCSDIQPSNNSVLIVGSGPYRIGSSVEFDWCIVNTMKNLIKQGIYTILVNANPETVSTDFDECDRLYFEPVSVERVLDILFFETHNSSVILSVGGQSSNNLALDIDKYGARILGTQAVDIDKAENRKRFSNLLADISVKQPEWFSVNSIRDIKKFAVDMGYPILIRPSYVLSGSSMNVAHNPEELEKYMKDFVLISEDKPVVISKFIEDAMEIEVDGVAKHGSVVVSIVSEHIENAGVHSGDATIVLPPQNIFIGTIMKVKSITSKIIQALNIHGPFNIQFMYRSGELYVIECNARASRSFPFVSKVTGINLIELMVDILLDRNIDSKFNTLDFPYVGVKVPQFSHSRIRHSDPTQRVEMNSTGEVACLGRDFYEAFWLAWLSTEQKIFGKNILITIDDKYKESLLDFIKELDENDWNIYSTDGTHRFLYENGVASTFVYKNSNQQFKYNHIDSNEQLNKNIEQVYDVYKLISSRKVSIIINIPSVNSLISKTDGFVIRRAAIDHGIPLITNIQIAKIFLKCLVKFYNKRLPIYELYTKRIIDA